MTTKTDLLSYQVTAVEKLRQLKIGALYMEMGTGKTRTALELIKLRLNSGKVEQVLWLCPCSVKANLLTDIKKHSDLADGPLTICGIETMSASVKANQELQMLVCKNKVFLVVDESNLVKNPAALRSRHIVDLAVKCQYKLILNGTPITRNEADLFNQWYLLDWRILGYRSFYSFAANHIEYDEKHPERIHRALNVDYLVEKISPYTFQIKKSECFNIPKKDYRNRGFSLTDEQNELYSYVLEKLLLEIDETKPETIYRLFGALQAITSGFGIIIDKHINTRRYSFFDNPEDNPRIQCFMNIINNVDDKCLVFCKYTREIDDLVELLNKSGHGTAVSFNGNLSLKKRNESIERFRNDARFMVANKNCGAYGLNLQFCHNVIYYSNDWDWGTRAQSEDRMHRYGQKQILKIIDIYASQTIDERIAESLSKKESLVDKFKAEIQTKQTDGSTFKLTLINFCGGGKRAKNISNRKRI